MKKDMVKVRKIENMIEVIEKDDGVFLKVDIHPDLTATKQVEGSNRDVEIEFEGYIDENKWLEKGSICGVRFSIDVCTSKDLHVEKLRMYGDKFSMFVEIVNGRIYIAESFGLAEEFSIDRGFKFAKSFEFHVKEEDLGETDEEIFEIKGENELETSENIVDYLFGRK